MRLRDARSFVRSAAGEKLAFFYVGIASLVACMYVSERASERAGTQLRQRSFVFARVRERTIIASAHCSHPTDMICLTPSRIYYHT